ncbi:hypothetical protein OESDEN_08818 [Oesophagostomum dentatum]|uniref:Uncharacterized protein n=1 Tax=Oesophagostomum dentatum TaxID=61180 RepID=A0A0B1T691_OESDE|nr:hypothetical protein OESDEN_08818 [Oesophagostomum dentatum]
MPVGRQIVASFSLYLYLVASTAITTRAINREMQIGTVTPSICSIITMIKDASKYNDTFPKLCSFRKPFSYALIDQKKKKHRALVARSYLNGTNNPATRYVFFLKKNREKKRTVQF